MAVLRLTDSEINKFEFNGSGSDIRWDSVVKGLGVRIYPTGRKVFVLGYLDHGRYRIRKLDSVGTRSIKDLRVEAREILRRHEKRSRLKQEFQPTITVSELADLFLENYAKAHRKSWKEDLRRLQKYIVPSLGSTSLPSVRAIHITSLHAKISEHFPIEANRVLSLVGRMFNLAKSWGYYERENPTTGIRKNKERVRERWVKPEEMPRLMKAIYGEPNLFAQKAILLYLLIGCRKRELLKAKWADVDFDNGSIRFRDTKNGFDFIAMLSEQALEVLRSIPRMDGNPYIIPGRHGKKAMVDLSKPWHRIREKAGLEDVTIHDLRRTFASWMLMANVQPDIVQQALNHSDIRTTLRYARRLRTDVRAAVCQFGDSFTPFLQVEEQVS